MPEINPSLENEWSLLRSACSAKPGLDTSEALGPFLRKPIDWSALFELAARHGVQPLLCQGLSNCTELVPAQEFGALCQQYQVNVHKALFLAREMISLLDCVESHGIEVVPYKGLALAESVYGDMALRQPGDIDLLIHPEDLPRIQEAVSRLGYVPHAPVRAELQRHYLEAGYECAFDGSAGRNLLEVQWAIQPRFYAVDFDLKGVFARAVAIEVAGRKVKTPSPEDLFIILSLHAAKHVWGRLIWLCDLERIMNRWPLDWGWIGDQAKQLGIARILGVTFLLLRNLLGAEIRADVALSHAADPVSEELAREIEPLMLRCVPFDAESFDYFRLMLRLRERKSDRARFLGRLILTPGPGEWETMKLPSLLFPCYRMIRLARLAARVVRRKR